MSDSDDMFPSDDPQSLIGADVGDVPETKWAKALVEFIEVGEAELVRRGVDETTAFEHARATVLAIAQYQGGRLFYLPRGERLLLALRDAEIYRRARAGNIEALAVEYDLTVIHVYRIIRQQRALHVRRIQPVLPFKEEG